ncbi:EXO70 [Sanghuangporus vaninii]
MEDEAAEIELLEQNLNKTRQISQRMISILTNFDTRLLKLEKSILPLHSSTQLLNRRSANIESTLQLIDEVASSQQGLAEEEGLILRGPQATQLDVYIDALERMNASIAFKGVTSEESRETARLVEAGAKKLAQLYTKYVAEASSGTPPSRISFDNNSNSVFVSFPEDIVQALRPIVSFLRTLPVPATHPSHPAAIAIQSALLDAQRGYADMRGAWLRKCLEVDAKRVVEGRGEGYGSGRDTNAAEVSIKEGREFGAWVEGVINVAENEYNVLTELTLLPSQAQLAGTYASLLTPLLTLLSTSLTQLTNRVKRALHHNTFLALATHGYLASPEITQRWEDVIKRRANGSTANINALKEGLHSLRAVCLRSFPEFLADIKLAAVPRTEIGTDVAEITETVVKYMTAIPAVQYAVGSSLLTLGDGNWKMGEGVVQTSKGPKLGEGDESIIIEHYLYDIVNTTLSTLTALSRTSRRPAIGSIFLLNNVSYFLNSLLDSSSDTAPVEALLAPPARNALQSSFRTAKAGYFEANYSPLLQVLGDGPGSGGSGKASVKEKFTRFYDVFEEIVERHRAVRVLPDDDRGREALAEEASRLVVPSLQRFIQKNKDFSKNPQKYIKLSPEDIEKQIKRLY